MVDDDEVRVLSSLSLNGLLTTRAGQSGSDAEAACAARLASLRRQSRSRNFQETVLEGASAKLRALVLDRYRAVMGDPEALLGHEGRSHSTA